MGRDGARATESSIGPARDLVGWGAFTTFLAVVVLFVGGASWTVALTVGALTAGLFAVVWFASRTDRTA